MHHSANSMPTYRPYNYMLKYLHLILLNPGAHLNFISSVNCNIFVTVFFTLCRDAPLCITTF